MAKPDTSKVAVLEGAVTGAIFVAPATTPLPTDGTTELSEDYKGLGFTSDEGITVSEDSSNTSIRAWEGRTEVRNARTEYTEKIAFTPIEVNEEVAKLTWGDDYVEVDEDTGNLIMKHHGKEMEPVNIVIETVPFTGAVARYCCKAQLTERGDVSGNGQDAAGRELTFNCIAIDGITMVEYICYTALNAEIEPQYLLNNNNPYFDDEEGE